MKHGRLIDADVLKEYFFRPYSNEESYSNIDIGHIIDDQPTVNAPAQPEIVRCGDCKHVRRWRSEEAAQKSGQVYDCAQGVFLAPRADDFCSKGERKKNE